MTPTLEPIKDVNPKTGIGKDYLKTFGPLNLYLRSVFGTSTTTRIRKFAGDNLARFKHKFRKYEEWFPENEFEGVVTDQNRLHVRRLDEIVDGLNGLVTEGQILDTSENGRALPLFNEAMRIILGSKDFDYRAICQKGESEINRYFW
ncbi:hypothetical protein J4423_02110 [Candidatus Pacearchaeota archaeon]|nr:hypothetical protein [Candidatus Pacearchaeota archaeon]